MALLVIIYPPVLFELLFLPNVLLYNGICQNKFRDYILDTILNPHIISI